MRETFAVAKSVEPSVKPSSLNTEGCAIELTKHYINNPPQVNAHESVGYTVLYQLQTICPTIKISFFCYVTFQELREERKQCGFGPAVMEMCLAGYTLSIFRGSSTACF